jgi:hypothetical protein
LSIGLPLNHAKSSGVAASRALYLDGSWVVDTGGFSGAPATYGTTLAPYMTRRTVAINSFL